MAREFAKAFYQSKAWKETRAAYFRINDGLCERCKREGRLSPGHIVHHKVHLTPENINDPSFSLSFDNLEVVCRSCHAAEHPEIYEGETVPMRVAFDDYGNVVRRQDG